MHPFLTLCALAFFPCANPWQHPVLKQSSGMPFEKPFPGLLNGTVELFRNEQELAEATLSAQGVNAQWFKQKLDHFHTTPAGHTKTWPQRYWMSGKFYKPGGPIFLFIGGEGELFPSMITHQGLEIVSLAKKYNAMLFAIEHRYYGESHPTIDTSTKNLKYLSSEQALADMANFIKEMNARHGWSNNKWITFGGSYSGALSAWMRELYPELVSGAVASSAPVQAKVDFKEYLKVVHDVLTEYSPRCSGAVRSGFRLISHLMKTRRGRKRLEKTLTPCNPPLDTTQTKDIQNYYMSLVTVYGNYVQYSGPGRGTIAMLCDPLMQTSQPILKRLKSVYVGCIDNSYTDEVRDLRPPDYSSDRQWQYQTCAEFGYYQTTNDPDTIFGSGLPTSYYLGVCADVYGPQFTPQSIYQNVNNTNKHYGGRNYNGTNVVLPNGTHDPWHALGVLTNPNPTAIAILINGTSHCANMRAPSLLDPPGLTAARKIIEENVGKWVGAIDLE